MYKFAAFLSFVVFLGSCNPKGAEIESKDADSLIVNSDTKARIDSTLQSFVDQGAIAGVSALIMEDNKEVYFNAFGQADKEADIPMDRNTVVRIFSMTKPITGVALMQLYEKGKFKLDDRSLRNACTLRANKFSWRFAIISSTDTLYAAALVFIHFTGCLCLSFVVSGSLLTSVTCFSGVAFLSCRLVLMFRVVSAWPMRLLRNSFSIAKRLSQSTNWY